MSTTSLRAFPIPAAIGGGIAFLRGRPCDGITFASRLRASVPLLLLGVVLCSNGRPLTGQTDTRPRFQAAQNQVAGHERVSFGTVCLSDCNRGEIAGREPVVFFRGHGLQVNRVATSSVLAFMVDLDAGRNRANQQLIRDAMGLPGALRGNHKRAVPAHERARELPTSRLRITQKFGVQPFNNWCFEPRRHSAQNSSNTLGQQG